MVVGCLHQRHYKGEHNPVQGYLCEKANLHKACNNNQTPKCSLLHDLKHYGSTVHLTFNKYTCIVQLVGTEIYSLSLCYEL